MATIKLKEKKKATREEIKDEGKAEVKVESKAERSVKQESKRERKVLYEDKGKREANVKHYRMSDGSYEAEIYTEPVHYYDEKEGRYRSIDNTLSDCPKSLEKEDDFEGYENRSGEVRVKFGKRAKEEKLLVVRKGEYGVEWKLFEGNQRSETFNDSLAILPHKNETERKKLSDEIRYNDVATGTDLQYVISPTKIKENIIVKERQEKYEYSFLLKLKNLNLELSENEQELNLYTNRIDEATGELSKETVFSIPMPYMYDAENAVSHEVDYELERMGENYVFKIVADKEWINAAERKFPVTIDPAIITMNGQYVTTKTVYSNNTISTNTDIMEVGYYSDMGRAHHSALFISVDLPSWIKNSKISSVVLLMHALEPDYLGEGEKGFEVRKVTQAWKSNLSWSHTYGLGEVLEVIRSENAQHKKTLVLDVTKAFLSDTSYGVAIVARGTPISGTEGNNANYMMLPSASVDDETRLKVKVSYTSAGGIVSNKQQKNSVNRAGTGVLDLYTQNLHFIHEDVALDGELMPLSLSHIYNSKFAGNIAIYSNSSSGYSSGNIGMGRGWKTNYHQYVFPYNSLSNLSTEDSEPKYCYIDQQGNENVLVRTKLNASTYKIVSENGNLTYDETERTLTDKSGNKLYFDGYGRLVKVEDSFGNSTDIYYNGDRIWRILDGGGRNAYFYYEGDGSSTGSDSGSGLLSYIAYGNYNRHLYFSYDAYGRMTKITYPDGTNSQYGYGDSKGFYYLTSIRDQIGYRLQYEYIGNKIKIKESTNIKEIGHNSVKSGVETAGNELEIEYVGNKTYLKPKDGRRVVHIFNRTGICYCSYVDESSTIGTNFINVANNIEFSSLGYNEMFAVTSTKDFKNYVQNGGFENYTANWVCEGLDEACLDGVTYSATAEGDKSYKIAGEIGKIKYLQQTVYLPQDTQSLIFSGFAKANSLPLGNGTHFRLCAKIGYSDGTWEEEKSSDFNYLESEWQLAAVGVCKSRANKDKTINKVLVKAEYSNNLGEVYFDNLRVTQGKYTRKYNTDEYYLCGEEGNFSIEEITAIRYTTQLAMDYDESFMLDTYEGGTFLLKLEDLREMLNQTITGGKAFIKINGEVKTDEAAVGEELWGNWRAKIQLLINGVFYNLFDFVLKQKQGIENGTGQTLVIETGLGGFTKSTVIDEYGEKFTTESTYDKGKLKTQKDFRNILTENTYNAYGSLIKTSVRNVSDNDSTNAFIQEFAYNNSQNTLHKSYEERGKDFYTTTVFNNAFSTLGAMTLPNGQQINYNYYSDDSLNGISTTVGTDTMSNNFAYTRGLLTKLTTNNNTYLFTYDGFGKLLKTTVNGDVFVENEYRNTSDYSSTDESTFDYSKITYCNGTGGAGTQGSYSEKTIFDKHGKQIRTQAITYDGGGNEAVSNLLRTEYDEYERVSKVYDEGLGSGRTIQYQNTYKDDGRVDYVTVSGYYDGKIQEAYDNAERLTAKTVQFGETKVYGYEYDTIGNSTYPDNRIEFIALPVSARVIYDYDTLSRIKKRTIQTDQCYEMRETYSYLKSNYNSTLGKNDRTTNYVSAVNYSATNYNVNAFYTYDKCGNISTVLEDGKKTSYQYDGINRLIRENNQKLGTTKLYEYDSNGNIEKIREYSYTESLDETTFQNEVVTTYTYSTGLHKDRLTGVRKVRSVPSEVLEEISVNSYDGIGNPCNYRGNVLEWSRGRNLVKYGAVSYAYNASGIRQEKTANGVVHKYHLEGTRIHKETYGNNTLWYYYDQTGITGLEYNGTKYYFQKNIQDDVVRIFDQYGILVASYEYDAWGNHKVLNANGFETTETSFIGNINPFRYRGYYYDVETGLYYLNSRYYDPRVGRFISSAEVSSLNPNSINGLNLYAYANNNPIGIAYSGSSIGGLPSGEMIGLFGNPYGSANNSIPGITSRISLPAVPWLAENATTIYGSVSSLITGIPILSHYYKYASIINDEFKLYGISKWKTSLQLSNVSFKIGALDGILIGANVLIDMYDSYQRGVSTEGILLGGALTAASGVGLFYLNKGIMWTTTTIGTAICPGIGTAIGFSVGLVGSILVDIFLGGWIADWIDNNIK